MSLKFAHVRDHDPVLRFHLLMRAQRRMRFAHVQFVGTEEALRAVRQGATHGFRYGQRLDVDSAPWVFYIGPAYRAVYISGWLASNRRPALLQWMYDIPNMEATVSTGRVSSYPDRDGMCIITVPPFREEERPDTAGWTGGTWRRDASPGTDAPTGGGSESAVAVGV